MMKNNQRHILIIHPKFCIRTKKQIDGLLNQTNYKITLISNLNDFEIFPEGKNDNINIIKFNFHHNFLSRKFFKKTIMRYVKDADIIQCNNEPNYHVVDMIHLFKGKIPIVYDVHDFTSLRNGKPDSYEEFAYRNSDAIIHVSEKRVELGEKLYGKYNCNIILSTPNVKYIQNPVKKTYSNNELHFVYQGGIYDKSMRKDNRYSYRYCLPYFKEILEENHHLHMYTNTSKDKMPGYKKLEDEYQNFHIHKGLKYDLLMKELSNYDYGIAGFNLSTIDDESVFNFLNATIGNKLFDYIFAGIPVVVINAKEMEEFVIKNHCGMVKHENKSWGETVKEVRDITDLQTLSKKYSMENQIEKLVGIYNKLW